MATASRKELEAELIYLRKSSGLTLERLAKAPAVIEYCGGFEVPLGTIRDRLVTAIRALDERQAAALLAAYGIEQTDRTTELEERRAAHAERVGRRPGTIREWEDTGIRELALVLMTSYYAGADTPRGLVIPHGGYLIEELHVVTVIRDRQFFESQQTRKIISLVDGAKGFKYGSYTPTELFDVHGATADPPEPQASGGTMHTLRFPRPLRRGQPASFSFRERVPAGAPDGTRGLDSDFSGQTFETPTLRYTVEVAFLGERPNVAWRYDKLSRIERPGRPTAANAVQLSESAVASATFHELYGGLCSGIAWRWASGS